MERRAARFAFINIMARQGAYHGGADGNTDGQIHFILVGNRHSSHMLLVKIESVGGYFSSITDDG